MILLFDIGNSRIKRAWLRDGAPVDTRAETYEPHAIDAWCSRHLATLPRPEAVWVANVAGARVAAGLHRWCRDHWRLEPAFAETGARCGGLINGYEDPRTLGVDRWLAMLGARRRHEGALCIIGCGTAVTVDVLSAGGEHQGGLIVPGPALMRRSLEQETQGVRLQDDPPLERQLGRSTGACVGGGSAYALAGLIESVLAEQRQRDPAVRGILSGGAAPAIRRLCRTPLEYEPDLVLEGLIHYVEQPP